MSADDDRAAFVAWADREGYYTGAHPRFPGEFDNAHTRLAWTAWRAAIAAEREAAAKVCDEAAAESEQDERRADRNDDDELSALACEARRTATYLAAAIRARGAS